MEKPMALAVLLLAILIGGWYGCWYHPLPHNMARDWRMRLFNFKGVLAYLVTGLLLCIMTGQFWQDEPHERLLAIWFFIFIFAGLMFLRWSPDGQPLIGITSTAVALLLYITFEQYFQDEPHGTLLTIWFLIFIAVWILFWIAPDGQRLDGIMGMTVTSNGRQLTLHLDTDQEYDVSRSNIHALANEIADLVEKTGLPLLITTPLSCSYLVGLLQKDPRIRFEAGVETKVPWPLWPMVAYRRHKRSRLPWGKAFTKSRNATSFCVHPLVQQS